MKVTFSTSFERAFAKFRREQPGLEKQFWKRVALFKEMPHHPSLNNHKLSGDLSGSRAFKITKDFRVVFEMAKSDEALFTDIGDHDDVY